MTRFAENCRTALTRVQREQPERFWAGVFFVNFFLIIGALYLIKPASRSLVLQYLDASQLPYLWIASAAIVFVLIGALQLAGKRLGGWQFIQVSLLCCIALLTILRLFSPQSGMVSAIAMYLLVDLMGVLLVEQCWSLVNSVFASESGRRWYGFIGAGGLLGGLFGGISAALMLKTSSLQTQDLPLVTADMLAMVVAFNAVLLSSNFLPRKIPPKAELSDCTMQLQALPTAAEVRILRPQRYLWLIAAALAVSQIISPLLEVRFMQALVESVADLDERTALLSLFFSLVSAFSIFTSLVIVPLILRRWDAFGVMAMQPVMLFVVSVLGGGLSGLSAAAGLKFFDRGLAYSSTRLAREMLFLPLHQNVMFSAKAWIDIFGHRMFKVVGAAMVLCLGHWGLQASGSEYLVSAAALLWLGIILLIRQEQRYGESKMHLAHGWLSETR